MTGTWRVSCASVRNTPRLPCLPPPPAQPAAQCLERCLPLPEEGLLSRHLFFSPSLALSEAIDIFKAGVPDVEDEDLIEQVDSASIDNVFAAQVKAFTDFTNVEGWADTQAWGIPRLEPPLAALLYPGA